MKNVERGGRGTNQWDPFVKRDANVRIEPRNGLARFNVPATGETTKAIPALEARAVATMLAA